MAPRRGSSVRPLSEAERERIIELLDAGTPRAEIAASTGRSVGTISNLARDTGRSRPRFGVRVPDPRRARVLVLATDGIPADEIAATVGLTEYTVRAVIRQAAPPSLLRKARDQTVADLWREGVTRREIGARVGLSENGVTHAVQRLGLPARRAGRPPKAAA